MVTTPAGDPVFSASNRNLFLQIPRTCIGVLPGELPA